MRIWAYFLLIILVQNVVFIPESHVNVFQDDIPVTSKSFSVKPHLA